MNVMHWLTTLGFLPAFLIKATIILSFACVAHFAMRKTNPRWRTLLWRAALVVVLLLPAAERLVPAYTVKVATPGTSVSYREEHMKVQSLAELRRQSDSAAIESTPSIPASPAISPLQWLADHRSALLLWLWAAIFLALVAASVRDMVQLFRALRTAVPAAEPVLDRARAVAHDLQIRRSFTVAVMQDIGSPFVAGFLRPVIVLPARLVDEHAHSSLRAVLAHELAHIKTNDPVWMAIARTITCILWFHPLAWLSRALHRVACEEACDGLAAAHIGSADAYGQVLAREALAVLDAQPVPGGVAMIRKAEIVRRIRRIHAGIRVNPLARRTLVCASAIAIVSVGMLSSLRFAAAQQTPSPAKFPHPITFETYPQKWAVFQPGDSIEILEVRGTAPKFEEGANYYVRGRYTLASHDDAELHVYATNGAVISEQGPRVSKGEGDFVRTFTLTKEGMPHVSFYSTVDGEGFGGTYFRQVGPQQALSPKDFPYAIKVQTFRPERAQFQPGDNIEILDVRGMLRDFEKDGRYYIRGSFVLESHETAELRVYATNGEVVSDQGPPIDKGSGEFVRTFTLLKPGTPYVVFYPVGGGDSFGGTYFTPSHPTKKSEAQLEAEHAEGDWVSRFNAVYHLNDGQILKRIAPPFISERMDFYAAERPGQAKSMPDGPTYMGFTWDGNLKSRGMGFSVAGPFHVQSIIDNVLGVNRGRFEGPASVLDAPIPGDWIVRTSSSPDERMRALADILRNEMGMKVRVDQRRETRTVVVVTGDYRFTPLPDAPRYAPRNLNSIHLYSDVFDTQEGAGGGTGKFVELLDHLGNFTQMQFLNESTASGEMQVQWTNHTSSHLMDMPADEPRRSKLDQLLNNLHDQTGLNYSVQDREVDLWIFSEEK